MTLAEQFVHSMKLPHAWDISSITTAKRIDRNVARDSMELDLVFYYFSDGSSAGIRPRSHQAWV